jgi:hypothetical protein
MTLPLTKQQEKLWRFIKSCERSPTYDEMCVYMGIVKSGICRLINSLERKGFVRRDKWRACSVVALDPELDLANVPTPVLAAELARRLAA